MLRTLLEGLGETDLSMVLQKDVVGDDAKKALTMEMYGDLSGASKAYDDLISRDLKGSEAVIVEERWVEVNRQLAQWTPMLQEYAEATSEGSLLAEIAWKSRDWDQVRKLCGSPSIVASLESGDPVIKLYEIYLAIADGKLGEVEKLSAQAVQLCLANWQALPNLSTGGQAHLGLLRIFQRLVELRESGHVMVQVSEHTRSRTFPDLKNLLQSWRERQPNEWDDLCVFDDLFVWRNHMFAAISSNFHYAQPSDLAQLHDRPWSVIKLSKVARKQGVPEVSLSSLSKIYSITTMDVVDAFAKLREQIVNCLVDGSAKMLNGGLNIINNTNLEYFNQEQKAELFRLKAMFLNKLGNQAKANNLFCQATMIAPSYARSWDTWGVHCTRMSSQEADDVKKIQV